MPTLRQFVILFAGLSLIQAELRERYVPLSQIKGVENYKNVRNELAQLVRDKKGKAAVNHFCVVGALGSKDNTPGSSDYTRAYVYWKEDNALILWDPVDVPDYPILATRRYWRLDKDVLPDGSDLGMFALPESYANRILNACKRVGNQFAISKDHKKN